MIWNNPLKWGLSDVYQETSPIICNCTADNLEVANENEGCEAIANGLMEGMQVMAKKTVAEEGQKTHTDSTHAPYNVLYGDTNNKECEPLIQTSLEYTATLEDDRRIEEFIKKKKMAIRPKHIRFCDDDEPKYDENNVDESSMEAPPGQVAMSENGTIEYPLKKAGNKVSLATKNVEKRVRGRKKRSGVEGKHIGEGLKQISSRIITLSRLGGDHKEEEEGLCSEDFESVGFRLKGVQVIS
ncbi:hypothetical protein PIB30_070944 [Stylosanthes scabra]|uniref:Uncharacterized protein n=1 Tax=Stylosanthes scabra TaxID=79078 RepID=A0ABU6ZME8_9FABA|nr:hypothetical protein [Stylosanthes scabra]